MTCQHIMQVYRDKCKPPKIINQSGIAYTRHFYNLFIDAIVVLINIVTLFGVFGGEGVVPPSLRNNLFGVYGIALGVEGGGELVLTKIGLR